MNRLLHHTIAAFAAATVLTVGGAAAHAETPPFEPLEELAVDDPCDPNLGPCDDDPQPEPDGPDLPDGPDDLTDDPCDLDEAPWIDDPCDAPDPEDTPEVPEGDDPTCDLDDVCTATPTFTG